MSKFNTPILYMFLAAALLSCEKSKPDTPVAGERTIAWNVTEVDGFATKHSLIDTKELMQNSCMTEEQGGRGNTIGIWADYSTDIDGTTVEVKNVFDGTELYYDDPVWSYKRNPAYWVVGGKYVFRAYYPQGKLNINKTLSNAKSLVIELNSTQTQMDVMLAHNSYDTVTGENAKGNTVDYFTNPVNLKFHHAMSALKFNFKFDSNEEATLFEEDGLKECWLETTGTGESQALAVTGILVFGNGLDYSEGGITWTYSYRPLAGTRFYHWTYPGDQGIRFGNTQDATGNIMVTSATAYTAPEGSTGFNGEVYSQHDGWLMILPQSNAGKLRLSFKTKSGGNSVFHAMLPAITGTSMANYITDPEDFNSQRDAQGKDFVPGWRYTYNIIISKTEATAELEIAPWNRLDSSFDIKFN